METNQSLIDVLNDLVKINNDRIAGYEKAAEEIAGDEVDLQGTFRQMANNSRTYARELGYLIEKAGGEVSNNTSVSGDIYRAWMSVKATFTGDDRKTILGSCEFGEDAAQSAYQSALESDANMDADARQLILSQKAELRQAHNLIKRYRDLQTV